MAMRCVVAVVPHFVSWLRSRIRAFALTTPQDSHHGHLIVVYWRQAAHSPARAATAPPAETDSFVSPTPSPRAKTNESLIPIHVCVETLPRRSVGVHRSRWTNPTVTEDNNNLLINEKMQTFGTYVCQGTARRRASRRTPDSGGPCSPPRPS